MTREEVYKLIDGERDYQDEKWNCKTTPTCGKHSVTEFLVYMQDYINEALHQVSRNADPRATILALHNIRKVSALGVVCMEQNGGVPR